jgi:hypothetical protein
MVHTSESAFSAKMETIRKREQMAYFIDAAVCPDDENLDSVQFTNQRSLQNISLIIRENFHWTLVKDQWTISPFIMLRWHKLSSIVNLCQFGHLALMPPRFPCPHGSIARYENLKVFEWHDV